ncbi:hypothetical protein LQR31_03305 [Chromobacterium vaccinii]|uniref:hypothetical protein n=1 Tax=Chromobacterium vaccinii TaxID=1108595 RepID=UPI001E4067E8|nr:hypothetical protein [Chromobacterium vaccinii]MCD4483499.1 hypothetical protein [Chromobacterium vaccinii]
MGEEVFTQASLMMFMLSAPFYAKNDAFDIGVELTEPGNKRRHPLQGEGVA